MDSGNFMVGLLPLVIGFAFAIYLLRLLARFVSAIEKIADKLDSE